MYDSWAKVKVGASVTTVRHIESRGQKIDMNMVYTLAEITPDKVVLDVKQTMNVAGRSMDMPGSKQEIQKSGVVTGGPTGPGPKSPQQPDTDAKVSEETLKIGDKEYKCHVIEGTSTSNGSKATVKTWMCPEVPGLLVKQEMTSDASGGAKMSSEVTKIELK
jgi:hypothetical protein